MRLRKIARALLAVALATLPSCGRPTGTQTARAVGTLSSACQPVESFGAIADDGLDDRAAIQAALNSGCALFGAGRYDVATPPPPRSVAVLTMPAGAVIDGLGADRSRIVFGGDPAGRDWRGIQLGSGARVSRVLLAVEITSTDTSEQTHVLRADGPLTDIAIEHVAFDHPRVAGSRRGDCIQFVGYPPTATDPDRRITSVRVSHIDFRRCARSGIGVHSGLHGFVFSDSVYSDSAGQDIDFEGSGDIVDGVVSDNLMLLPPPADNDSSASVAVMLSERVRITHNVLMGRGLDVYGCGSCEIDHNRVTQSVPGFPGFQLRKLSPTVRIHDELWVREAAAGASNLAIVAHKTSAPSDVEIADSSLVQHTEDVTLAVSGIVGFRLVNTSLVYDGPTPRVAVVINGSAGTDGIRSTDLHVLDSRFTGPFTWALTVGGSYAGLGTLEVRRNVGVGVTGGLSCVNVNSQGGITGPIGYSGNSLPAPQASCAPLLVP